jgi:transposase
MILGGFDVHRRQITFDWVDRATGEAQRGQIAPATREVLGSWLDQLPPGGGHVAVEGCTGWRFVAEELQAAGLSAHLAEPADTATLRGRKRRAKTDRADARHLRELLEQQRLPESWIPPAHILDLRELVRLRKTLIDQRTQWKQRIHAVLFHHGLPKPEQALGTQAGRAWLAGVGLPPPSRLLVDLGLAELDTADARLEPISGWLRAYAAHQPGCRALRRQLLASARCARRPSWPNSATPAGSATATRWCAMPAWTSRCGPRTPSAAPATWLGRAPRCCAGRCSRRPSPAPAAAPLPITTTPRSRIA